MAAETGRLKVSVSPEENARELLAANPVTVLPIDTEIAILSWTLTFSHSDPADRFIAATAYRLGCPLATVDKRLTQLSWLKTL